MGLAYRAQDEISSGERSELRAGRFGFKVDTAEESVFKSGNEGLKLKLLVAFDGRDVPCFANLAYTPKALWRVRQFLDCVGCDFENSPDAWELVGKTGMAQFVVNERGYFEVKDWLDPVEQTKELNKQPLPPQSKQAPSAADDDVPF